MTNVDAYFRNNGQHPIAGSLPSSSKINGGCPPITAVSLAIQEDYIEDESQSTNRPSSKIEQSTLSRNTDMNEQTSSSPSKMVEELIPTLGYLLNTHQPSTKPLLSMKKSHESPVAPPPPPQAIPMHPAQTPRISIPVLSRNSNKSFSNRLGMPVSNPTSDSSLPEARPIPILQNSKSPSMPRAHEPIDHERRPPIKEVSSSVTTKGR